MQAHTSLILRRFSAASARRRSAASACVARSVAAFAAADPALKKPSGSAIASSFSVSASFCSTAASCLRSRSTCTALHHR